MDSRNLQIRFRRRRTSVPIALTFAILFNFAVVVILFLYSEHQINTLREEKTEWFRLLDAWGHYEGSTINLLSSNDLNQAKKGWARSFLDFEASFRRYGKEKASQKILERNAELGSRFSECTILLKEVHAKSQELHFWLNLYLETGPEETLKTSMLHTLTRRDSLDKEPLFYEETTHLVGEIERIFNQHSGRLGYELRSLVDLLTTELDKQANEVRLLSLLFAFSIIVITVVFIIYGQRSIRSSEERFKHTVEFSPYPIALMDASENIEYVNPEFVGVFGYTLEDIPTVSDFFDKSSATEDSLRQIDGLSILRPSDKEGVESYMLDIRCKDGSLKHVSFRLVNLEGKRRFIFCEDMTSRITAERALIETNDTLNALLEAAPLPIFALDRKGCVDFLWNPAAERLLGWKKEEVLGRPLPTVSPEDRDEFLDFIGEVQSGKVLEGVEARRRKKDGTPIDYGIYSAPLHDAAGGIAGSVSLLLDLTDFKRNKQERENLISELEAKNMELERFTYTVSHDLKSPLITIKGFLGLLEEDIEKNDTEQMRTDMSKITMAAEKMQILLQELLELSRIGRQKNPPEQFAMSELAQEVVDTLEGVIRKADAEVRISEDMPPATGDRPRIFEVLQNLIENAIKYCKPGERPLVEICSRTGNGLPVYCVKDNGIGIDERYRDKIFGLFEKLDRHSEGTGVGLALVKRIVDVHKGRIWVESSPDGSGSVFCFSLPVS